MSRVIILIVGTIKDQPVATSLPAGQSVINFIVAAREYSYQTRKHEAILFRVTAYGKLADSLELVLKEGQTVAVDGTLVFNPETGGPRTYKGNPRFEVDASHVRFIRTLEGTTDEDDLPDLDEDLW